MYMYFINVLSFYEREFELPSWLVVRGDLWQVAGQGTPFSTTNKTDLHDIAEILLKSALNIITLTLFLLLFCHYKYNINGFTTGFY
jgi:hypothetical protein